MVIPTPLFWRILVAKKTSFANERAPITIKLRKGTPFNLPKKRSKFWRERDIIDSAQFGVTNFSSINLGGLCSQKKTTLLNLNYGIAQPQRELKCQEIFFMGKGGGCGWKTAPNSSDAEKESDQSTWKIGWSERGKIQDLIGITKEAYRFVCGIILDRRF